MVNILKSKVLPALKWFLTSFIWVFLIMLALDIISKNAIRNNMAVGQSVDLIPGFLRITYVLNYNAAFGIGAGNALASRIIYIIVASLGSIGLIAFYVWKYKRINPFVKGCMMLILTGALGNLIDRLFYGPEYAVVDFIDFYFLPFWNFVFNIADCGVVIGAIALVIYLVVEEVKDYRAKNQSENPSFDGENNQK